MSNLNKLNSEDLSDNVESKNPQEIYSRVPQTDEPHQTLIEAYAFNGPLPPPEMLEGYNRVIPHGAL